MSKKYFHALIIEDDPFASDIMMMLLARDYRTHVAGELTNRLDLTIFDSLDSLRKAKKRPKDMVERLNIDSKQPIDVVILDTEVAWDVDLPVKIMEKISKWAKPPKILCTCTYPNSTILQKISEYKCFSGYLVKSDILYSVASAVCLAANDYYVFTPQVCSLLEKEDIRKFPGETLIVSSRRNTKSVRESEKTGIEILRLNLIFNLPKSDIHEELCVTEKYINQVVSKRYSSLQIADIVSGEISLNELFENPYIDNQKIIEHYQKILGELSEIMEKRQGRRKEDKRSPKFRNMSTLAFHLLTRPDIEKW